MDPIFEAFPKYVAVVGVIVALVSFLYGTFTSYVRTKETNKRVLQAEQEAFKHVPEALQKQIDALSASQTGLEEQNKEIAHLIEVSKTSISMASLFNLYSKQIEKYQQETRSRASLSFAFAIVAMFAGLSFIFWGGTYMLKETGLEHIAAGSAISVIGGAISAYITKTFLDIHRLSLNQLNTYFKQPVQNDHILMAQRLADELTDGKAKQGSYEIIIKSVTNLIREGIAVAGQSVTTTEKDV